MTLPIDLGPGAVDPPPPGDRCPSCQAPVAGSWLTCGQCGVALAVASELPPGTLLLHGRFAVGRVLGRGGFGITYETDDTRLHRAVALKELFPESAVRHGSMVLTPPAGRIAFQEARERFLREARVLARFNHPGIVRVFEVFEEHGTAYLVLELVRGRTLADVLRGQGRPLAVDAVLDVARRVGGALSAIHQAGLLHRDVSPANLIVTTSGRIVLIDFGLARAFDAEQTSAMTRMVTPGYAPPEQYLGSARYGPPTDVYGLAATLYRLLTGSTLPAAIDRQHGTELPSPARINPEVPKAVADAILDGLELNPDHRPQTVDAFLARLGLDPTPGPVTVLPPERRGSAPADPIPPAPESRPEPPPAAAVLPERGVVGVDDVRTAAGGGPVDDPDHVATEAASTALPFVPLDPDAVPTTAARPSVVPTEGPTDVAPTAAAEERRTSVPAPPRRPSYVVPAPLAPLPSPAAAAAPDAASYLPGPVIGPPRSGRWLVVAPLTIAACGVMAAVPVLGAFMLVVVLLPGLATGGDLAVHHHRRRWGGAETWFQRRSPSAAAGPRYLRNLAFSVARAGPGLVLLAVLVVSWYQFHDAPRAAGFADAFLRGSGIVSALVLVIPGLRGSLRFATPVAVDALHLRIAPVGRRLTQAGWILWVACIAVACTGLLLTPDVWPLHS